MKKFKVGQLYEMKSPCDQDCKWSYTVIKRTPKTVVLFDGVNDIRCRIKDYDNQEFCKPLGTYSMSPTLKA